MRLAMPSAFVATAIVGGLFGASHTGGTVHAESTSAPKYGISQYKLPSTYKSWKAQKDSVKVCVEMRKVGTKQWVGCLVGHYEYKTSYKLNNLEFTANKAKNTFKVTWSKVTLPKGGVPVSKANKVTRKLPTDVYFKSYKLRNGALILGSNGTSFQE